MFGDAANMPCYTAYNQRDEFCPGAASGVFKTGKDKVVRENFGIGADGKPVWSKIATPIRDKEGIVTAALNSFSRSLNEKSGGSLQESEKQLRFLSSQLLTVRKRKNDGSQGSCTTEWDRRWPS
jgi:hypothetical protein